MSHGPHMHITCPAHACHMSCTCMSHYCVYVCRLQKALRELNKQIDSSAHPGSRLQLSSSQLPLVDRALGEINRSLASEDDQLCFCQLGGVACVLKLLVLSVENCMSTGEEWGLPLK